MKYRLVHMGGSLSGRVDDLEAAEVVLGRDPSQAQVVYGAEDREVSRRHAAIRLKGDRLFVCDLGSTAGTFLKGRTVSEAPLADGDVVELGSGGPTFRIELGNGKAFAPGPATDALPVFKEAPAQTVVRRVAPDDSGEVPAVTVKNYPIRPVPDLGAMGTLAPGLLKAAGGSTAPLPVASGTMLTGQVPVGTVKLVFILGERRGQSVEVSGSVVRIGRAPSDRPDTINVPDTTVSAQHARLAWMEGAWVLKDLESRNGTFLNGRRVFRETLRHGDVIGLGGAAELRVELQAADPRQASGHTIIIPKFAALAGRKTDGALVRELVLQRSTYLFGRDPDADVRLDSPIVSQLHARLSRRDGALSIEDLNSSNGTYVDGVKVKAAPLAPGGRAVVGPFVIAVPEPVAGAPVDRVRILDTRDRARLDVHGAKVTTDDGHTQLEDISLSVAPGTLTAFIGPSGAGKSTLLAALGGLRTLEKGEVRLNGLDLKRSYQSVKADIGFVPQDDIVHTELTVSESLEYTARLRLPPDTTAEERQRRIGDVLATLELTDHKSKPISLLSGGQRKRVSIATELLTEPSVLLLDEPASGLDPGLEESLMLLLRELSHRGKTVVLVTHTLDNIHLCDAVALLVEGKLAFYGPPADAQMHFGIEHLVNLYACLKQKPPAEWQSSFRASALYKQTVDQALADAPAAAVVETIAPDKPAAGGPGPTRPVQVSHQARPAGAAPGRQFGILTSRYLRTLTRDVRNAILLAAQAPIVAGLIGLSLLYGQSDVAYTKPKNTLLFLLALTAVWFGCSNAVRELVKERAVYLRERRVNLGLLPYVLSKLAILGALALAQCVVFLVILDLWFGIPGHALHLLGAMLLCSFVGILLGLTLSAASPSADRAMTLLPLLLIPQVLFTVPAVQMDMKGPAGLVARVMPTWWGYDLLRRVALAPDLGVDDDGIEKRLQDGHTVLLTKERLESMLQDGYQLLQHRSKIETTWTSSFADRLASGLPASLGAARPGLLDAGVLLGFAALLLGATLAQQRRYDHRL